MQPLLKRRRRDQRRAEIVEWLGSNRIASEYVEYWWLKLNGPAGAKQLLDLAHDHGKLMSVETPEEFVQLLAREDHRGRFMVIMELFRYVLDTVQ